MIGSYDDVSHRIVDAFGVRQFLVNTGEGIFAGRGGDIGGLFSQEWGDPASAITTMAYDRPVTLVFWFEHGDTVQGWFCETQPYGLERPLRFLLGPNQPFVAVNAVNSSGYTHTHESGVTKHWDLTSIRNFPHLATLNWKYDTFVLRTFWHYSAGVPPISSVAVTMKAANTAIATTRFEFYHAPTTDPDWQNSTPMGPILCLDRALSDTELQELARSPWRILRQYWSDVLFLVSPLTGEDFGPRHWNFEAQYSKSETPGEIESGAPIGLVPWIDYSSQAVRGKVKSFHFPSTPYPILEVFNADVNVTSDSVIHNTIIQVLATATLRVVSALHKRVFIDPFKAGRPAWKAATRAVSWALEAASRVWKA